jgi:Mitochondrial small ribosomal subunit Rsm22
MGVIVYAFMLGLSLVRPLELEWRRTLDAVALQRGWPTSQDVAALAACVARLSSAYNDPAVARATMRDAGAARLGFSFARDVPKGAAAVRELVATGALAADRRPATQTERPAADREHANDLRVLDLGAGLGATTWGLVRALEGAPESSLARRVDATWVDPDAPALELGLELVRERPPDRVALRIRTIPRGVGPSGALEGLGPFDVVLVGQLLSELDVGLEPAERLDRHTAFLAALLEHNTGQRGSLVIIEPALRGRTRHLHAVRDRLVSHGATVFAPCTHAAPCPALDRESDWCHEDLPVDLPPWLVPIARAAGLRREGLTFSYLVLRKDGVGLAQTQAVKAPSGRRLRVVSDPMRSKGKREAFVCGELLSADGKHLAARVKATRLERDRTAANAAWDALRRGDLLAVKPSLTLERARISDDAAVSLVESR